MQCLNQTVTTVESFMKKKMNTKMTIKKVTKKKPKSMRKKLSLMKSDLKDKKVSSTGSTTNTTGDTGRHNHNLSVATNPMERLKNKVNKNKFKTKDSPQTQTNFPTNKDATAATTAQNAKSEKKVPSKTKSKNKKRKLSQVKNIVSKVTESTANINENSSSITVVPQTQNENKKDSVVKKPKKKRHRRKPKPKATSGSDGKSTEAACVIPVKSNDKTVEDSAQGEGDTSTPTENLPGKSKKRKSSSSKRTKKISGSSNWAALCTELKTDPYLRKTHQIKALETTEEAEEPPSKVAKLDVWFDDVDKSLLEGNVPSITEPTTKSLVKDESFTGPTKCIAMDCEMVGIGKTGEESILARVSLVNHYGHCLYDKFVSAREPVTDYRTAVSGVTKELLQEKGEPFMKVQKEVSDLLKGKILVGHALHNDLKVLFLSHPHKNVRDTSKYKPFRDLMKGGRPALKKLTAKLLGVEVQAGEHSSVEDAQAAMRLYTMHRKKWEKELKDLFKHKKKNAKLKKKESA